MLVDKHTIVEVMVVGAGADVALAAAGGTPASVYTTVEEVEIITLVGPCEAEITGATFFTSAAK